MTEMTPGAITFPDFKYYKLDRDTVKLENGELTFVQTPKRTRAMHMDILQSVFALLKGEPAEKQRWKNALLWSWFNWIPDYFFTAPASSTHKHHPGWANRPDGLLLHSACVCRCAIHLLDLFPDISDAESNAVIFAAWHHDMFKYGELDVYQEGKYTVHEHPVYAADFFRLDAVQGVLSRPEFNISSETCRNIANLIQSHSGPYRNSRGTDFKLPECVTPMQKLVYKADWFASRKEGAIVQDLIAEIPDPDT